MEQNSIDQEREFSDIQVAEWILHKIFYDASILEALSGVHNREWYSDDFVGTLIDIIIKYYKKHGSIPTKDTVIALIKCQCESQKITLSEDDLISTFLRIITAPINVDGDAVNLAIEIFVKNSGLYSAFNSLASSKLGLSKKKVTVASTVKEVHRFEDFTLDSNIGLDYFSDDGLRKHKEYLANPASKLPTGIEWIDKITSGGVYKNGHFLGIFAAAPNVGKSVILGNLAYNFLHQNKTVLIITLEMSEMVYARRISSLVSGACIDDLSTCTEEAIQNVMKFRDEHPEARLIIKEYPTGGATPLMIENYLEELKRNDIKPDVILIDYLNLLKPSKMFSQSEKQYIQVGYITKEIRGLSAKIQIPIFSATQSNREGYGNTEVGLSNISQSTAVAEDSDLIVSAYSYDEDVIQGIIKLKVIKSRLGGKAYPPHKFQIDKNTLMLVDMGDASVENDDGEIPSISNIGKTKSGDKKSNGEGTIDKDVTKDINNINDKMLESDDIEEELCLF